MPFVDLTDEDISLYYRSNTSEMDPARPTLLFFAGTVLDSASLDLFFSHPVLSVQYNLLGLDLRSRGQTKNAPFPPRDIWTDAADAAAFLDRVLSDLSMSVHVFAVSSAAIMAAECLALLWPERVLSLTLLGIRGPDQEWMRDTWTDLMRQFHSATDIETMEDVVNEIFPYAFGEWLSEEQKDVVAEYFETQYPPTRATRLYDFAMALVDRPSLPADMLAMIRVPVLIINGDAGIVSSPEAATELKNSLVNVPGGVQLHIIHGAPDQMHYISTFAPTVIQLLLTFLLAIPAPPPAEPSPSLPLHRLAEFMHDPSIATRHPNRSLSFSCVPPAEQEQRRAILARLAESEKTAFSPFGPNGEPPRKFSERPIHSRPSVYLHHWTSSVEIEVTQQSAASSVRPSPSPPRLNREKTLSDRRDDFAVIPVQHELVRHNRQYNGAVCGMY